VGEEEKMQQAGGAQVADGETGTGCSGTEGAGEGQWKPSELKPGAKLSQPAPLFKKLEEKIVEEERERLGK